MIYPPGVTWESKDPPSPERWWHQLQKGPQEHHLDPEAFSAELNQLLSRNKNAKQEVEL